MICVPWWGTEFWGAGLMHEAWLVPVRSMAAKDLTPFPPESLGYVLNLVSHLSCLHAVIKWTERLIF